MKILKDYKGVALIYLVLTIINVIWIVNYDRPEDVEQVKNETKFVLNS